MVVSIAVMMASFRRSKNQTAGLVVQKKAAMYALPREILCDVSLSKYSVRHCVGLYLTTLRPKLVLSKEQHQICMVLLWHDPH